MTQAHSDLDRQQYVMVCGGAMTSTPMQRGLDAVENAKPANPATHALYTPVWQPEWEPDEGKFTAGKFRAWLAVGDAWQDDSGGFILEIHSQPLNHEETATSYFRCIPVGRPKPDRLTITCRLQVRTRLPAGGGRIRTSGSRSAR